MAGNFYARKFKDLFPEQDKIHEMETRNPNKFKLQARAERSQGQISIA